MSLGLSAKHEVEKLEIIDRQTNCVVFFWSFSCDVLTITTTWNNNSLFIYMNIYIYIQNMKTTVTKGDLQNHAAVICFPSLLLYSQICDHCTYSGLVHAWGGISLSQNSIH